MSISPTTLKIAIVSDAYFPHVSGVATTIRATARELEKRGHTVRIISVADFTRTVPLPGYPEIKLVPFAGRRLARMLDALKPDAIHISVEGPLGLAARSYCLKRKLPFTTAYHTRFPEYVHVRVGIPVSWTYAFLRWFHGPSKNVLVASHALIGELKERGIPNTTYWPRGVDIELFNPANPTKLESEKPIFMYMGRVAVEKNLEAFLSLDLPGTKYVVGDGPARKKLEVKYPNAIFTGYKFGEELASHLAAADVFVFSSLTDTLGLVMLEANACGVPVASFYSQASCTVVTEGVNGVLSDDLKQACLGALRLDRARVRDHALNNGWSESAEFFLKHLAVSK